MDASDLGLVVGAQVSTSYFSSTWVVGGIGGGKVIITTSDARTVVGGPEGPVEDIIGLRVRIVPGSGYPPISGSVPSLVPPLNAPIGGDRSSFNLYA